MSVDQESSAEKARCALGLAQYEKGSPQKSRQIQNRSYAESRDGCGHDCPSVTRRGGVLTVAECPRLMHLLQAGNQFLRKILF